MSPNVPGSWGRCTCGLSPFAALWGGGAPLVCRLGGPPASRVRGAVAVTRVASGPMADGMSAPAREWSLPADGGHGSAL